jgi:hypothetical protein
MKPEAPARSLIPSAPTNFSTARIVTSNLAFNIELAQS